MIRAYLAGISTHYEGEDIEIRYHIYENQSLISKKSVFQAYRKPAIVGQVALLTLLKELEQYIGTEIIIIVNDAALKEQIRGTTKTKNKDVLKMSSVVREELTKFKNLLTIKNVSGDRSELAKWNEELQP
ncbi:hypothetical protein [Geosporobacter ferrireducens]|uniref:RNase H type-1 domain-containing protein n=1 Tax=Geosporobacter ferrireducens TaxID=1424294 RepID=A0A1D8GMA1_9FIRM|nr:hypothetical protein [Geosporobacter ferrireducens]AOT72049.1 hypothetical protein Gferi_22435 [Geosporobacter ferrireducens]MTI55933.1 hypothetical protein [Geosporobacter ferrireducens]